MLKESFLPKQKQSEKPELFGNCELVSSSALVIMGLCFNFGAIIIKLILTSFLQLLNIQRRQIIFLYANIPYWG